MVQEKGLDVVIIDTPARAEPINAAAAQVADFCLIPCQPSLADMRAQSPIVQTLKRLEKRGAFVLTRCPTWFPDEGGRTWAVSLWSVGLANYYWEPSSPTPMRTGVASG